MSISKNKISHATLCLSFLYVFNCAAGAGGLRTRGPGLKQAVRNDLQAGENIEKGMTPENVKRQQMASGERVLEVQLDEARRLIASNPTYFEQFAQFDSALNKLKAFIAAVHKKFADASNKSAALAQVEVDLNEQKLRDIKDGVLSGYLKVLEEVRATEPSNRWKGTVPKTVIGILTGNNKQAFADFQEVVKGRGGIDNTPKDYAAAVLRDNNIRDTREIMSLLDELEKYLYRMERRKVIKYPTAKRNTRHFIKLVHEIYPDLLTLRDAEQIDNLGDAPLAYLVSYAQGLLMVINDMQVELNKLKRKYA